MMRVLTTNALVQINPQVHADLRLAWKLMEDAGYDDAANRVFQFMQEALAVGDLSGTVSEYEQVKTTVEVALSNTRAALNAATRNRATAQLESKSLMGSIRTAVRALDDPHNALLATLRNAVYELEASQSANERMRDSSA